MKCLLDKSKRLTDRKTTTYPSFGYEHISEDQRAANAPVTAFERNGRQRQIGGLGRLCPPCRGGSMRSARPWSAPARRPSPTFAISAVSVHCRSRAFGSPHKTHKRGAYQTGKADRSLRGVKKSGERRVYGARSLNHACRGCNDRISRIARGKRDASRARRKQCHVPRAAARFGSQLGQRIR